MKQRLFDLSLIDLLVRYSNVRKSKLMMKDHDYLFETLCESRNLK